MADYAIGDVQGCFDALQRLLDKIQFNERSDRLWFVGDLVNRGPQSLDVLRFIKQLPLKPNITLGNHDLHLLSLVWTDRRLKPFDATLNHVLLAPDCEELCDWLRHQPLLCFDASLNVVMCHAGIAPMWTLAMAQGYAQEIETILTSPDCAEFLSHMYGNTPNLWSSDLSGMTRLRVICNYFTRMRYCFADGGLDFEHHEPPILGPADLYPWFALPNRVEMEVDIVFGHWAALQGQCPHPKVYALDTGCVWGKTLTALRLQDKHRVAVSAS